MDPQKLGMLAAGCGLVAVALCTFAALVALPDAVQIVIIAVSVLLVGIAGGAIGVAVATGRPRP